MDTDIISIKGIKDGILVFLSPTEEWGRITAELASRIDEQSKFFAGATITVDVGERPVPKHELMSLKALLERRGLTLAVVLSDSQTTNDAAVALDVRISTATPVPGREPNETLPIDPEEVGTPGILIRRTMRSGRIVHSDGHVVIFGDVNPGAKIIADGDVIVWGKLRGMVHAGAQGNEEAIVCALDMSPTQLRIAGHIVTSPSGKRQNIRPEVALIRENQIYVEAWEH